MQKIAIAMITDSDDLAAKFVASTGYTNLDYFAVSTPLSAKGIGWNGFIVLNEFEGYEEVLREVKLRIYNYQHLTQQEMKINETLLAARHIQDYLWKEHNYMHNLDPEKWASIFQKRVDKIKGISQCSPNYSTELRKRILQQAALSIAALENLDGVIPAGQNEAH